MTNGHSIGLILSLYNDIDEARILFDGIPSGFFSEVCIFDDGSEDDIVSFARPYSTMFPVTILRSEETRGFGEMNQGATLKRINTEWVIRHDADERFKEDNWTDEIVSLIDKFGGYIDAFRIKNFNFLDGKEFPGFPFNNHIRLFKKTSVYFPPDIHSAGGEIRNGCAVMSVASPTILHMKTMNRQKNAEQHYINKLRKLGNARNYAWHYESYMRGEEG
jgi:hypothetical protein